MAQNTVYSINGPVVKVKEAGALQMQEKVLVGHKRLIGEVISVGSGETTIQVYEGTTGMRPGEPVEGTGGPMCAALGPGILSNIFDGIERPLREIAAANGAFIPAGGDLPALDMQKKWDVAMRVREGDRLTGGQIFAVCPETSIIEHRAMVPPGLSGTAVDVRPDGAYTAGEALLTLQDDEGQAHPLSLTQFWPIREPRPVARRLPIDRPLITGQRVIDTLFPVAKGGTAAIPGGFGTGKTMTQHQLAKWSDADIIVYIGCGERGNEMTDVLNEFPELKDPKTGRSLMERTVLIANTSDMPVAAREASIYTGITIAEYFRDMGYSVALMADSTSRWAEALREMSGRLEEMPGEEGYPAYLGSRLAQFYERAGRVITLGKEGREGSLSAIGAVSPPGGDISEPVSQATLRIVKVFWSLDSQLAYQRHFPAINWLTSYSLYIDTTSKWFNTNVNEDWSSMRQRLMLLLQEEAELDEIVKLVGMDALSAPDRLKLEAARSIREDFLHQNSFHDVDTYTPLEKQFLMMKLVLSFYDASVEALNKGVPVDDLVKMAVRERIGRFKYVTADKVNDECAAVLQALADEIAALANRKEEF